MIEQQSKLKKQYKRNEKRTILYLDTAKIIGGAEISLLTLMQYLPTNYPSMLVTRTNSQLIARASELGLNVVSQEFPWFSRKKPWKYWLSIVRLWKYYQEFGAVLIHTNCDFSLRFVHLLHRITGVPYISHVRDFVRPWFLPPQREALFSAKYVVCNSQAIYDWCAENGLKEERLVLVYNPVDFRQFQNVKGNDIAKLRAEWKIQSHVQTVGLVGQIQPIKGHREFIEAALQILSYRKDVIFLIVGAAPESLENQFFLQDLLKRVYNAGYEKWFRFIGFRSDIAIVMNLLDILVVPSWTEPFGRVAVEGMAAGCAVIASNSGGLTEIITDNVDGILVPPRDVQTLRKKIDLLLSNKNLRIRLAQRAKNSAKRFSAERHVEQMIRIYERTALDSSHRKLNFELTVR